MPKALSTLLLLVAGIVPSTESLAAAFANVSLLLSNGRSFTVALGQTGFAAEPSPGIPNAFPLILGPGESASFSVSYSVSVKDDGLPVQLPDPLPGGCALLPPFEQFCGPPSGVDREQAEALFSVGVVRYPGQPPSNIQVSIDGPTRVDLLTNADSFSDFHTQSGSTGMFFSNPSPFVDSIAFYVQAAGWVLANPIPEPATYLQLVAGLGVLGLMRWRRYQVLQCQRSTG